MASQFKELLKKDIRLTLSKKALISTVIAPVIFIILITLLPAFLMQQNTIEVTIVNHDSYIQTNSTYCISVIAIDFIIDYYYNHSEVEINVESSYEDFQKSDNAIFIPSNFSSAAYSTHRPYVEFKSATGNFMAESVVKTMLGFIEAVINNELSEGVPPSLITVQMEQMMDVNGNTQIISEKAASLGRPLGYAIFLLIALVGSTSSKVSGFNREKHDGMLEVLLIYTTNRKHLLSSKILAGMLGAVLTTVSYLAGMLVSVWITEEFMTVNTSEESVSEVFAIGSDLIIGLEGLVMIIAIVMALTIVISLSIAIEVILPKDVADRIGTSILLGAGLIFYFTIAVDPNPQGVILYLNPFFWPYEIALAVIDGYWLNALTFVLLWITFIFSLISISARAIEMERVIYD
ncbi:MAG: ABC transporter permease [Candidatus Kariarchaeaceae archaeon]